jgi:hypothetical protein
MATAAAKTSSEPIALKALGAFIVDPARVKVNDEGFGWRSIFVRLPSGMTADALKDPAIWSRVQGKRGLSLRLHDHVYAVGFDETWSADCVVAGADHEKAVLSVGRIHTLESGRFDAMPSDDTYKVVWTGEAFVVVRKSDHAVMTTGSPNIPAAAMALARLYPKVA